MLYLYILHPYCGNVKIFVVDGGIPLSEANKQVLEPEAVTIQTTVVEGAVPKKTKFRSRPHARRNLKRAYYENSGSISARIATIGLRNRLWRIFLVIMRTQRGETRGQS